MNNNSKSDKQQNLSKLTPFPNHGFVEKGPDTVPIIKNVTPIGATQGQIEIEYVNMSDWQKAQKERDKEQKERDIKLLIDNKSELDKTAIYYGFKDVEDWITKHNDIPNKDFSKKYMEMFPYVHDWVRVRNGNTKNLGEPVFKIPARDISYNEYKTGIKKDEVLFEEKYNEMKRKEKMVEEMWEKYPLTTNFKVTENEPINMQFNRNKDITEEQIEKANIRMDENNFDQVARNRTVVYNTLEETEDKQAINRIINSTLDKYKKKPEVVLAYSEKEQTLKAMVKDENCKYIDADAFKNKDDKYKKEMQNFYNEFIKDQKYEPDWVNIESLQSTKNRVKNTNIIEGKPDNNRHKSYFENQHGVYNEKNFIPNNYYEKCNNETIKQTRKILNKNMENRDDYSNLSSELDAMEARLINSDGFDEEQIQSIKERIKLFEDKLKEKVKPKTITISNNVHNIIKNYCNFYNIKIGDWVEKTLMEKIEENTPTRESISVEKAKEELEDKYKNYGIRKQLVSSERLLALNKNSKKFKFIGFGVNGKPIYDYVGSNLEEDTQSIGCNVVKLPEGPVNISTKYQLEYADVDLDEGIFVPEVDPVDSLYLKKLKSMSDKELSIEIDELIRKAKEKR